MTLLSWLSGAIFSADNCTVPVVGVYPCCSDDLASFVMPHVVIAVPCMDLLEEDKEIGIVWVRKTEREKEQGRVRERVIATEGEGCYKGQIPPGWSTLWLLRSLWRVPVQFNHSHLCPFFFWPFASWIWATRSPVPARVNSQLLIAVPFGVAITSNGTPCRKEKAIQLWSPWKTTSSLQTSTVAPVGSRPECSERLVVKVEVDAYG